MGVAITAIVGFASALVGAVVGFVGALHVDTRRTRRTRTGVVRALIGELRQNAAAVILALYSGSTPATDFSSETWRAANFELAQFLSEGLYKDILFIYQTLPVMKDFCSHPVKTQHAKAELQRWLERVKKAMSELQELPEAAKFRLERVEFLAWPEEEAENVSSREKGLGDKAAQTE